MTNSSISWLSELALTKGRGGSGIEKAKILHSRLEFPGDTFKTFHVAGTNGKGSVSCLIAAALGALGYKVGLYSSPHLERINERIVIDGMEISNGELELACTEVRDVGADQSLSFFEVMTMAAFVAFRRAGVDFGVVEVGIGGRLDATNVLASPVASTIVSIDFDHENVLGNTLALIAGEKAGILRGKTPLVTGPMNEEALSRIRELRGDGEIRVFDKDFGVQEEGRLSLGKDGVSVRPPFLGAHQRSNLAVALASLYFGLKLYELAQPERANLLEKLASGAAQAYWPNRLESIVWRDKKVILDSAHNVAGIETLISFLDTELRPGERVSFVFGAVRSKRWREMITLLVPRAAEFHLCLAIEEEGVDPAELAAEIAKYQVKSTCYESDIELERGLGRSEAHVLVGCGSMYLTGRLRRVFGFEMRPRWIPNPAGFRTPLDSEGRE